MNIRKKVTLPKFLSGGEFFSVSGKPNVVNDRDRNVSQTLKNRLRGGSFDKTGNEIDHIVSVALGGTDSPTNLQPLKSPPSPINPKSNAILFAPWLPMQLSSQYSYLLHLSLYPCG